MRYDTKHRLVGATVTTVVHNKEYKDMIHTIFFEKNGKKYTLNIEGYDCETKVKPLR